MTIDGGHIIESHVSQIRICDPGNVIETHENAGDFKEG